jgi:hypothetical protein
VAGAEYCSAHIAKEAAMRWLDKLLGREKKTAGEMTGDSSMEHEGMGEETAAPSGSMPETPGQPAQGEQEPPPGTP